MTVQDQIEKEVTLREQLKKFLIKGCYGFNTILTIGLGRRLGIFDYLYDKAKVSPSSSTISSVEFTLEELIEKSVMIQNILMSGFIWPLNVEFSK